MSGGYDYATERETLFTDDGQKGFLKIRDRVHFLLEQAGAFTTGKAIQSMSGSSWFMLACLDRLVELGEIRKVSSDGWSQYHVYTGPIPYDR